jgi:hypothetical protein
MMKGMNRTRWIALGVAGLVIAVAAFAVFRPDKLFVDQRVDERLDTDVAAALDQSATGDTAPSTTPSTDVPATTVPTTTTPPGPVLLGRGEFVSQGGHTVRGTAAVVSQPDGSRLLVLEELDSQNGPDLQLYLSPEATGRVDGGIKLAPLKGNQGTQIYELPRDVDLGALPNVVIWCERFSSPFGTATVA